MMPQSVCVSVMWRIASWHLTLHTNMNRFMFRDKSLRRDWICKFIPWHWAFKIPKADGSNQLINMLWSQNTCNQIETIAYSLQDFHNLLDFRSSFFVENFFGHGKVFHLHEKSEKHVRKYLNIWLNDLKINKTVDSDWYDGI